MLFKIFDLLELDITVQSTFALVSLTFKFSYADTIDF